MEKIAREKMLWEKRTEFQTENLAEKLRWLQANETDDLPHIQYINSADGSA